MRILFAASEVYPLAKTGGLADVAAALPAALAALGVEIRVIMPAYPGTSARLREVRTVAGLTVRGQGMRVLAGRHPDHAIEVLLVDAPTLFDRPGNPYGHADDAWRFGCFCEAIAQLAAGAAGESLAADLVHLNDWHTGLVPVHLHALRRHIGCVFTIHNLAYQGCFERAQFDALGLPATLWHPDALEFHGRFSFLKSALTLSDALTTVSPTYAREIQTPAFGEGLDGVLRQRAAQLAGILNGIDDDEWNPAVDRMIAQRYDATSVISGKFANKRALQAELGLGESDLPMLAFIGRLAYQKGADALLAARQTLEHLPLQIVVLASGDPQLESGFEDWAAACPGRMAVRLAYDERLAHRIEAGADMLIMPSRYEPCGLNQMYSQRYGTIPLVRKVGGLADSVDDFRSASPTGIQFENTDAGGVIYAVRTALECFAQPERWHQMQANGMARDWSWTASASRYLEIYRRLS